jgi:predicted Zn-dependent protease
MIRKLIIIFLSVSLFSSSYLTEEEKKEIEIGNYIYQRILKEANLSKDIKKIELVQKVGFNIAKIIDKDYNWEFILLENKNINALCLPGGKVIVNEGLFRVIENEDQLAAVLSHEIAHVLLRHGGMKAKADAILSIPQKIGKDIFGDIVPPELHGVLDNVYNIGKNITVMLPYNRHQEIEADKLSVRIMHKANYNSKEAIQLWRNMERVSPDNVPEFLSTHPNNSERIKSIQEEIRKL